MDPTALQNISQIRSFPQFRNEHKIYLKTPRRKNNQSHEVHGILIDYIGRFLQ